MRTALFIGLLCLAATACNTVEGFGRDVSATGKAISGAANDVKSGDTAPRSGARSGPPNR